MSEMVERVAKALYDSESRRADQCVSILTDALGKPVTGLRIEPWGDCEKSFMDDARIAIEAMREPTEAMKTAAYGPIMHGGREGPVHVDQLRRSAALTAYEAMIDSALTEEKE